MSFVYTMEYHLAIKGLKHCVMLQQKGLNLQIC